MHFVGKEPLLCSSCLFQVFFKVPLKNLLLRVPILDAAFPPIQSIAAWSIWLPNTSSYFVGGPFFSVKAWILLIDAKFYKREKKKELERRKVFFWSHLCQFLSRWLPLEVVIRGTPPCSLSLVLPLFQD